MMDNGNEKVSIRIPRVWRDRLKENWPKDVDFNYSVVLRLAISRYISDLRDANRG